MPQSRIPKRQVTEYKALLRVDVDWCSSGIWEIPSPLSRYAGKCVSYEALRLPLWLIERFNYWTSWHDSLEPKNQTPELDAELFRSYAFSLAVDLKRVLGDDYYVEYGGREIHDDRAFLQKRHCAQPKRA